MSLKIRYPYDPVGENPECLVTGERYALSSINNSYRSIIPEFSPFFGRDVVITHWPSGKTLKLGVDFEFGSRVQCSFDIASEWLYGSINFKNPDIGGEIAIEQYRTIGGNFTQGGQAVMNYLANVLVDPAILSWEDVLGKLEEYPVQQHAQNWHDFGNKARIAQAIDTIPGAMDQHADDVKTDGIDVLSLRLAQLEALVTSTNFSQHIIDLANPHQTNYSHVQAMAKTGTVKDALKLYAMTLQELATYINNQGITQAQLDAYLSKYDDAVITKKLILKEGVAKISNGNLKSTIDLANGDVVIKVAGTGRIGADRDRNKAGKGLSLTAGKNVLRTTSEGTGYSKDTLLFNNKVVIHIGNIRAMLTGIDFGKVSIVTGTTETAAVNGIGTQVDPITVSVTYPVANDTREGIGILATTYGNSISAFASAKLLAQLVTDLTGYVPATTTINGFPLTSDVTIPPAKVHLGNVNNTSDKEKPISTEQQRELNRYANKAHSHELVELEIPYASDVKRGITYHYGLTVYGDYATISPAYLEQIGVQLAQQLAIINKALDKDSLPLISLTGDLSIVPENPTSSNLTEKWTLNLVSTQVLYSNGSVYVAMPQTLSLEGMDGSNPINKKFYIYASPVSAIAFEYMFYTTPQETNSNQIFVGEYVTGPAGPVAASYDDGQSFGVFKELLDHIADANAHLVGESPKGDYGLGLLENYPMRHSVNPFSAWSVGSTWREVTPGVRTLGWLKEVDAGKNTISVDTTGLGSLTTKRNSLVCDEVNMWEHLRDNVPTPASYWDPALYEAACIKFKIQWNGTALNNAPDAALSWLSPVFGSAVDPTGNEVELAFNVDTKLSGNGQTVIVKSYAQTGTDSYRLAGAKATDPYQIAAAGPTGMVVEYAVYWRKRKSDGKRDIAIIARVGEIAAYGDCASMVIDEVDMEANATRVAAFNSGKFGFALQGPAIAKVYLQSLMSVDKKQYASTNMLIEALRRGSGIVVASGITTGNYIPMPVNCSKALVMVSLNSWDASSSNLLTNFVTKAWWYDSNQGPGVPNPTMKFPNTDPLMERVTSQVESRDGTSTTNAFTQTYNYLVIGLNNPVDVKVTD